VSGERIADRCAFQSQLPAKVGTGSHDVIPSPWP